MYDLSGLPVSAEVKTIHMHPHAYKVRKLNKQSFGTIHLFSLAALCVVSISTHGLRSMHQQTLL